MSPSCDERTDDRERSSRRGPTSIGEVKFGGSSSSRDDRADVFIDSVDVLIFPAPAVFFRDLAGKVKFPGTSPGRSGDVLGSKREFPGDPATKDPRLGVKRCPGKVPRKVPREIPGGISGKDPGKGPGKGANGPVFPSIFVTS